MLFKSDQPNIHDDDDCTSQWLIVSRMDVSGGTDFVKLTHHVSA